MSSRRYLKENFEQQLSGVKSDCYGHDDGSDHNTLHRLAHCAKDSKPHKLCHGMGKDSADTNFAD